MIHKAGGGGGCSLEPTWIGHWLKNYILGRNIWGCDKTTYVAQTTNHVTKKNTDQSILIGTWFTTEEQGANFG